MRIFLVLLGGGLGSVARYLAGLWLADRAGVAFPWGTLAVNVTGSLLIGVVATLADEQGRLGASLRLFLIAGVLGGFTTYSSFSMETLRLLDVGRWVAAALYIGASLALGLGAALLGIVATRTLMR